MIRQPIHASSQQKGMDGRMGLHGCMGGLHGRIISP
jgi:hypothetical protein